MCGNVLDGVKDVSDGEGVGELEFFFAHVVDIRVVNNVTNMIFLR